MYRDSRGLARALTGNTTGAIEDFAAFVDYARGDTEYADYGERRQGFIDDLAAGVDPFDRPTLESLRTE
jgi:hypothetical protein